MKIILNKEESKAFTVALELGDWNASDIMQNLRMAIETLESMERNIGHSVALKLKHNQ